MPNTQIQITKGSYYRDIIVYFDKSKKIYGRAEISFSRGSNSGQNWNSYPWVVLVTEDDLIWEYTSLEDASVLVALFHLLCL